MNFFDKDYSIVTLFTKSLSGIRIKVFKLQKKKIKVGRYVIQVE